MSTQPLQPYTFQGIFGGAQQNSVVMPDGRTFNSTEASFSVMVDTWDGAQRKFEPTPNTFIGRLNKRSEQVAASLAPGSVCDVTCRIKLRQYTDKNGATRTGINMDITNLVPLAAVSAPYATAPAPAPYVPATAPAPAPNAYDNLDDDLPF